jgi:gluconolactonase
MQSTVTPARVRPLPSLGPGLPVCDTTVVAEAAPAERSRHETSAWLELQQRPHCPSFLEGLNVGPDGALYAVDLAWGRLIELTPDGETRTLLQYDGQPNGLALAADGSALISDFEHGLLRVDRVGPGAIVAPLLQRFGMDRFKGLNDVLVGPGGVVYLTDQGGTGMHDPDGRIFRLGADGDLRLLVGRLPSPNALALDAARRVLYVAVTRDNAVWRIPLRSDGTVAKVARFIQLSGGMGPDGVAVTPAGWLLVTHPGLGLVWLFDDRGRPVQAYGCAAGDDPTSVTVDVPGGRALIAEASSGSILAAALPEAATVPWTPPTPDRRS